MADQPLNDILLLKARIDDDILPMDALDRFLLSKMYHRGERNTGCNHREKGEQVITNGKRFVQAVLPFSDCDFQSSNAVYEYANPLHVLAGAYYGVPQRSLCEAAALADFLDKQGNSKSSESAHYVRIGKFELYVASEGKNRVSIYRKLNRPIGAQVHATTYPPNHHLRLIKVHPFGEVGLRYVGDDREFSDRLQERQTLSTNLAALPFLESVRLLESYGVQWGASEWCLRAPIIARKIRLYVCRQKYIR